MKKYGSGPLQHLWCRNVFFTCWKNTKTYLELIVYIKISHIPDNSSCHSDWPKHIVFLRALYFTGWQNIFELMTDIGFSVIGSNVKATRVKISIYQLSDNLLTLILHISQDYFSQCILEVWLSVRGFWLKGEGHKVS